MTIASTNDVYAAIIARIQNYVPTGTNPEMPAQKLGPPSGKINNRIWILQAPDAPALITSPYVTLRMGPRQTRADHAATETFELEVDVWARPRNAPNHATVVAVADQIDAALADWIEPTVALTIYADRLRDTILYATAPADRDVIREHMRYSGRLIPYYLHVEIGSS